MIKKVLLFLITLTLFIIVTPQNAHAITVDLYFYSNNSQNIDWEVGYRLVGNLDSTPSNYDYSSTIWRDWTRDTACSIGHNSCVRRYQSGVSTNGIRQDYGIQWGTGCIDPFPRLIQNSSPTGAGEWSTRQNITYNGAGINYYETHGGRNISFGGFNNTNNCPSAPSPRYEIDGRVFIDDNGDGNRDGGESFRNGVTVRKQGDNTESDTTQSYNGNGGYYRFYNLPSRGDYRVWVDMPSGYRCSPNDDCDVRSINLGPNKNYDFGIVPADGPIGGKIYRPDGGNYTSGANVVRKANSSSNYNESNRDLSNGNGNYNFPNLNGGGIHDIKLSRTGDEFSFSNSNKIDSCVYVPQSGDSTPWVKENMQVPNNDVNFRLDYTTYTIRGKLWWDPDGSGGGSDIEPYVNYDPSGTANDIPGKSVTVRITSEGRDDTTDGSLGPNNSQAGRFAIGGNNTDSNGKNYSVQVEDRANPPGNSLGIRSTHRIVNEDGRPNTDRKVVTVNCNDVSNVDFYITSDVPTFPISGVVWVDGGDGVFSSDDTRYTGSYGGQVARIRIDGSLTSDVNNNGGFTVPGNRTGSHTAQLLGPFRGNNFTVISTNPINNVTLNGSGTVTAPAGGVRYLLRRNSTPTTFEINGGLFRDEDPFGGAKVASEVYIAPSGTERITINGTVLNTTNFPGSSFNASGFNVPNLAAGVYDIAFLNVRSGSQVSFHPGPYNNVRIGTGCTAPCDTDNNAILRDFGISDSTAPLAWFQGVGGDIRADNGLTSAVPAGSYLSEENPSLGSGVVFGSGLNLGGTDPKNKANSKGWLITGVNYASIDVKTSFGYIEGTLRKSGLLKTAISLFGGASSPCRGSGPVCNLSAINNGVYTSGGNKDVTIQTGSPYTFSANSNYVILVDGDLRITNNIIVPNTSTVLFIVKGNISVASNVTQIQGIFSADNNFTVETGTLGSDVQLIIQGNVIANAAKNSTPSRFLNNRVLPDNSIPAVQFVFRPDFVLNAPELVRYSNYKVREVAPGSTNLNGPIVVPTTNPTPRPATPTPRPATPTPSPTPKPTAFIASTGTNAQAVMETENYDQRVNHGGDTWEDRTTPSGFSGEKAQGTDGDSGVSSNSTYTTTAAELRYRVYFGEPGTYHVWLRGNGPAGDQDATHVGLNGNQNNNSESIVTDNRTGWGWSRTRGDDTLATMVIPSAGLYTINVWKKEPGARIDKIILRKNTSTASAPSGAGPSQSTRSNNY